MSGILSVPQTTLTTAGETPVALEPPIVGNPLGEIRKQRITCLTILSKQNLDRDPRYKDVLHEPVEVKVEVKNDGTIRNENFLYAMKPVPGCKPKIG